MNDGIPSSPTDGSAAEGLPPLGPVLELADRGTRLGASILDGLIMIVPFFVVLLPCYAAFGWGFFEEASGIEEVLVAFVSTIVGSAIYLAINGYLLKRDGQTVGKRICKIRIVKKGGGIPTLWESFVLRFMLVSIAQSIPVVGNLFALLDPLMIFRENRRCLHDELAGTIVVKVY